MAIIKTLKSGNWSDPSIWSGAIDPSQTLQIDHNIVLDTSATVAGINIGTTGVLNYLSTSTITLQSSKNIVVNGNLIIGPVSQNLVHTLRFIGINEDNFVGGGDVVLDTDIGLWVVGAGQLTSIGFPKTGWTNAQSAVSNGDTHISVNDNKGWVPEDEIMIVPTEQGATNYDVLSINSINGLDVSLSSKTTSHSVINSMWTAEVANLTRTVRIEGTPTGKSHVFIKSTGIQAVAYTSFRYMGPRKMNGGTAKSVVVGRYALHYHHCEDATRGAIVRGCVIRDTDNHSFVPHGSHGMTFVDNVAYNVTGTPYWYDMGHETHDLYYSKNMCALVKYAPGALQPEDSTPEFGASGFLLGMGYGNTIKNCVAVGVQGTPRVDYNGGYEWRANNEGRWTFQDNLSHHCVDGIRTWQNSTMIHVVEGYNSYFNITGIFHGAYTNNYRYTRGTHFSNPLILHAGSDGDTPARVIFDNHLIINGGKGNGDSAAVDAGIIVEGSPVKSLLPVLLRDNTFVNCKNDVYDNNGEQTHNVDVVGGTSKTHVAKGNEILRVQPTTGQPFKVTSSGTTSIPKFAPTIWGMGMGLTGTYYTDTNFSNPVLIRIDPFIDFQEWSVSGIHYNVPGPTNSVRWVGKIMPQFSEVYTFTVHCDAGGSGRLVIGGKEIISNNGAGTFSFQAGGMYDIVLEFRSTGSVQAGINMFWNSTSLNLFSPGGEYVPQSQLFAADSSITTTSTTTKAPSTTTTTSTTTKNTSTTSTSTTSTTTKRTTTSTTTTTTTTKMPTTSTTTTTTTTKPGPKVIIELFDDNTWKTAA